MKKTATILVSLFLSYGFFAQQHYYWAANSDFSQYGRVIDIKEVTPNVVALQTFKLNSDYSFVSGNLSLFDLTKEKEGNSINITSFESYRGGFGQMADGSLVINTLNAEGKYDIQLYKPNSSELNLEKVSNIEGSFAGIPGGIVPVYGGGYVLAASLPNKDNGLYNLQLFAKTKGHAFGLENQNNGEKMTINLLMKPSFVAGMHNLSSVVSNPNVLNYCTQLALFDDEKTLALIESEDKKDKYNTKVVCFGHELEERWKVGFLGANYGFKPLTIGEDNEWFLTTFNAGKGGVSVTTIQKFNEDEAVAKNTINEFEANGSMKLKNGKICVYGFKTYAEGQKSPAFHIINPSDLTIVKSWELSEKDKPCTDISELMDQTIVLPGKFYTATQLENGDVIFGGHIISLSTVKDPTTKVQTTFNYMLKMPASFFK